VGRFTSGSEMVTKGFGCSFSDSDERGDRVLGGVVNYTSLFGGFSSLGSVIDIYLFYFFVH